VGSRYVVRPGPGRQTMIPVDRPAQARRVMVPRMGESLSVDQVIAAPAASLWAMVADVTRMGEWSPENTGCEWVGTPQEPVVGARFRGTNQHGKKKWTSMCAVVDAQPGKSFAFDVKVGPFKVARWAYTFEPEGDGACRVTETWTDRRGKIVTLLGGPATGVKDRAGHNRSGMEATLAALSRASG
jgi:uncharacterized protein YndB with AHSA1/START domain